MARAAAAATRKLTRILLDADAPISRKREREGNAIILIRQG